MMSIIKRTGPEYEEKRKRQKVAFDSRDVFLNATENGELDIVQEKLSEGVDPCHTNLEGVTGLHNSSIGGHLDIVKLLTEKGADVNACDSDQWTPLHAAATGGNLQVVEYLVSKGADVNAENCDGETPYLCTEDEGIKTFLLGLMSDETKSVVENDQSQSIVHELREQLRNSQTAFKDLEKELIESKIANRELERAITSKDQELELFESFKLKFDETKNELEQLRASTTRDSADDSLKLEILRLETLVSEKVTEIKNLEENVKQASLKLNESRETQDSLVKAQEQNLISVQNNFDQLVTTLEKRLEEANEEKNQIIAEYEKKLNDKETSLTSLKTQMRNFEEERNNLLTQIDAVKQEGNKSKNLIERQKKNLEEEFLTLNGQLSYEKNLREQLEERVKELETSLKEHERLQRNSSDSANEKEDIQTKLKNLEEEWRTKYQQIKNENSSFEILMGSLKQKSKNEIDQLKSEISQLVDLRISMEKQQSELINSKDMVIEDLEKSKADLEQRIAEMQSRSLVSEDSQESILNSKLQVTKTLLDEKKLQLITQVTVNEELQLELTQSKKDNEKNTEKLQKEIEKREALEKELTSLSDKLKLVLQNQQQQQQQNQSQSQQQNQNENIQSDSTPSVIELQDLVLSDKEKRMAINNKYLNSLLATSKKEKQDLQEQVEELNGQIRALKAELDNSKKKTDDIIELHKDLVLTVPQMPAGSTGSIYGSKRKSRKMVGLDSFSREGKEGLALKHSEPEENEWLQSRKIGNIHDFWKSKAEVEKEAEFVRKEKKVIPEKLEKTTEKAIEKVPDKIEKPPVGKSMDKPLEKTEKSQENNVEKVDTPKKVYLSMLTAKMEGKVQETKPEPKKDFETSSISELKKRFQSSDQLDVDKLKRPLPEKKLEREKSDLGLNRVQSEEKIKDLDQNSKPKELKDIKVDNPIEMRRKMFERQPPNH